jgi:type VI secretion system protein ImpH
LNAPHRELPAPEARVLLPALLHDATRMNFMRFCELIELAAPNLPSLGSTDSLANEPVRFRSRARLGFPGKEIDAVEFDYDDASKPPAIRTTFLGLYGVDARMPSYFIDEVAQNRDGAEPLSGSLDMFHHRIATQFYRAWRKYRFPAGFAKGGTDDVSRCLVSLVGLWIGHPAIEQSAHANCCQCSDLPANEPVRPRDLLACCNTPCLTQRSWSPNSIRYGFS